MTFVECWLGGIWVDKEMEDVLFLFPGGPSATREYIVDIAESEHQATSETDGRVDIPQRNNFRRISLTTLAHNPRK